MLIKLKDKVKFRTKEGNYEERVVDRCLIIGQKFKLEEKVSKNGNTFVSLTLVEHNTYYHMTVFDKEVIDVVKNDISKDEMLIAICDVQVVHNQFKNCDEEKYIMTSYMSNRKILLDSGSSVPVVKRTKEDDKDLDFDDDGDDFTFDTEDLPF